MGLVVLVLGAVAVGVYAMRRLDVDPDLGLAGTLLVLLLVLVWAVSGG